MSLFVWLEPLPVSTLLGLDRVAIWVLLELSLIVYGLVMLLSLPFSSGWM